MKRYPPFEPPEYVDWSPDEKVMNAYEGRFEKEPALREALEQLGAEGMEALYKGLLRNRLHDITLKRWVRTGVLTKAWLGTGEEAATVGAVHALESEDVVGPMIRNAAACFERGIPLDDCFKAYLATGDTVTKGRDLHIGDLRYGVVSPISHVGDLVPVLAGQALAFKIRSEDRVAVTWVGDGATRTGAFHEGLAMAASQQLPLIVVVQDNRVALGTRRSDALGDSLASLAAAYAPCQGFTCDGNHVVDVYATMREARRRCIAGEGPAVVVARTFRMGGHATHDEAEGRALFGDEEFQAWGRRDPVGCFEAFLARGSSPLGREGAKRLGAWEKEVTDEVEEAAARALDSKDRHPPDPTAMEGDVIAG